MSTKTKAAAAPRKLETMVNAHGAAPATARAFRFITSTYRHESADMPAWAKANHQGTIPVKVEYVPVANALGPDGVGILLVLAALEDSNPCDGYTVAELRRVLGGGETTLRRKLDRVKRLGGVEETARRDGGKGSVWRLAGAR